MSQLKPGLYERLLDAEIQDELAKNPEVLAAFESLESLSEPKVYAQFIANILSRAMKSGDREQNVGLVNQIIDLIVASDGTDFFLQKKLIPSEQPLLTSIGELKPFRPETPLSTSLLLTGQNADPPLEHELRAEMFTADALDILVSFIKWSGLRLLRPGLERMDAEGLPVRIISTSYMGASDPAALEWLARRKNVQVRISYDTSRTRLHAKAYHFIRESGYSTAYIGSANMSHSAMTQGLEWTIKATNQDMPHVLERFSAEFETYWENREFEPYTEDSFKKFRRAISAHNNAQMGTRFFSDIKPHSYQERILEALEAARDEGSNRNLVVAATGTGKTVISAFDYKRFSNASNNWLNLLFVAHRKEIIEQALDCFRCVLRDQNFGDILAGGSRPCELNHLFATIQSVSSQKLWTLVDKDHFDFIIIDEAHHGTASSYRALIDRFTPQVLLGLTATPERMDGSSILPDFDDRFAAEIRLPEALEEKLLCPFHYFGVTDSIDLSADELWLNGKYDRNALESVLTGDDIRAKQRVDTVLAAIDRYQPDIEGTRAVGFCAGIEHASYMRDAFRRVGLSAETIVGNTRQDERGHILEGFRAGRINFLFAVDVLSEGIDVPEINMVLFLRPTESLTVFLQQLGRGLRHADGKDSLTVLDFVGQTHRKYRLDQRYTALLSRRRLRIDKEVEADFPHLPPGCSIQLERIARATILEKIRSVLGRLNTFVPEAIKTWDQEHDKPLTFGSFVDETGLAPTQLLKTKTWSEWKAQALGEQTSTDEDLASLRGSLKRISLMSDPSDIEAIRSLATLQEPAKVYGELKATKLHYLIWGKTGPNIAVDSLQASFSKWKRNKNCVADAIEIAEWRRSHRSWVTREPDLPYLSDLRLHAAYSSQEIKAALGVATLERPGSTGVGVIHAEHIRTYIHLVTFRKEEAHFSPTTRYEDYLITPTRLHWQSQSTTTQESKTGQNYINFKERGYSILFFARVDRTVDGQTMPFAFLGQASELLKFAGDRPISMEWELANPVPAEIFEEVRAA
jgi:superfamily II DNA or RNA helicase